IFDHDATEKLRTYFSKVCADFEAELVEMDGEPDHVHLLINYPPKLAISSLVNSLKGVSGRLLRRDRPDITVRYYYKGVLWSPGYFASSCGGAPISAIRQYIEQQQTPGQVENRAVYPRPEGRGFTAHRINQAKRMLVDPIISPKRSNINIHLQWVDIWLKNIVFLSFIQ
ncbi:TPA: IS200/IS605 family transposase, partial [Escherichia coli]|nr:IS200/IS605 family transposase [Escherichia coli]